MALPARTRVTLWSVAKVAPPVSTVTVACSPSAMLREDTARLNAVRSSVSSLARMVTSAVPIGVASWLAASVIVSAPSASLSSSAVMVALPEVAAAAIVMLAGVIV